MGLSLGRALGYALKGTATGFAKAAQAEDERRDKYTQVTLASSIKKAQANEKLRIEREAEALEEVEAVKDIMKFAPNGKLLTKAEATQVYKTSKNLGMKAEDVIKNFKIASDQGAGIKYVEGSTKTALPDAKDMTFEDTGGLFAQGASESILNTTRELLKGTGYEDTIQMPKKSIVEGVTLTPLDMDKYKGFEYRTYTVTDADGTVRKGVPGLFNPEKGVEGRILWDVEKNDYVQAPAKAVPEPKTTKTVTDEDIVSISAKIIPDLIKANKKFPDILGAHSEKVEGAQNVVNGLERMSEYALDDQNYSVLAGTIGSISRGVKNEIAGFTFVFSGDQFSEQDSYDADTLKLRNGDGTLNVERANAIIGSLDDRVNSLSTLERAEGISRASQMMETQALRLAIAELVADGDARPSDFDVQTRIKNYKADSPTKFVELATLKVRELKEEINTSRNKVKMNEVYTQAKTLVESKDADATSKQVLQLYISGSIEPILNQTITTPSFLTEGFDKTQLSDKPVDLEQPIIEVVGEGDKARKRIIMPDNSYLKDGGKVLELPVSSDDRDIYQLVEEIMKGKK